MSAKSPTKEVSNITSIPVEGHDIIREIRVGRGRSGSTAVKLDGSTEVHASKGAVLKKYHLKEVKGEGGVKAVSAKKKATKPPAAKKSAKAAS